jgi:diguanylate cyclase (GGDEF)-like protein
MRYNKLGEFFTALVFVAAFIFLNYYTWLITSQARANEAASEQVQQIHRTQAALVLVLNDMIDIETGGRGYVIVGNRKFLEPYLRGKSSVSGDLDTLASNISGASQQNNLAVLKQLIEKNIATVSATVHVRETQGFSAAQAIVATTKGKLEMDAIRSQIAEMHKLEDLALTALRDKKALLDIELIQKVKLYALLLNIILVAFAVVIYKSFRNRHQLIAQLNDIAHTDSLTGAYNRRHLATQFPAIAAAVQRRQMQAAILLIDLDGFKQVNDQLGHDIGDDLLIEVTQRLRGSVRANDMVVRLGGDEFVVFISEFKHIENVRVVAEKICTLMAKPFRAGKGRAKVTASIGIAIYPDHGLELEALLQNADHALYSVKGSGKNNFRIYTAEAATPSIG